MEAEDLKKGKFVKESKSANGNMKWLIFILALSATFIIGGYLLLRERQSQMSIDTVQPTESQTTEN